MPARFVDVIVQAHPDLPDGCAVTFQVLGEPRPVSEVRYRPGVGAPGTFAVQGRAAGGAAVAAQATSVRVTGGPPRVLVSGGPWGLRLTRAAASPGTAPAIAEPYLLLDDGDVLH